MDTFQADFSAEGISLCGTRASSRPDPLCHLDVMPQFHKGPPLPVYSFIHHTTALDRNLHHVFPFVLSCVKEIVASVDGLWNLNCGSFFAETTSSSYVTDHHSRFLFLNRISYIWSCSPSPSQKGSQSCTCSSYIEKAPLGAIPAEPWQCLEESNSLHPAKGEEMKAVRLRSTLLKFSVGPAPRVGGA